MSSKKRIDHDGARIYELLNPKPKELLQKRRTLVKSGDVIMWSNNEKILKKRYLFLFEDVLLITKKEFTQNYWLKIFITLKPEIKADLFKASKYKIPNVEFRIHCQNATFALFGKSREEAETWVRDINKGCGHNQRRNDEDEPRRETPKKREEYSDVQKYNKTGESKKETKQLNIDENLIPNQFFDTGSSFNDTPPTYHESIQSQQQIISQPTSQPTYSNDLNNLFSLPQQNNNQQINNNNIPQQQYNIPQQQFQFTGNTNMFGNFPPQQQQNNIPQQNFQPQQQQNNIPQQQQDTNLFNPFLQQQQFVQPQQQQQTFSVVAFEQNGLKIVFDFPPKENGIILLNMRSTNANNIPITNFSIKMAAPSYVDLKMAVASGEVLQVNNSNAVEQRVKLLNTLQGIKPLILKIKIDGQFGNELISLVHTVSTLPENI